VEPRILEERLFTDSGREQEFVIMRTDGKNGAKIVEPVVKAMIDQIASNDIDVLIIDPFISTHEVEENDNTKMQQVQHSLCVSPTRAMPLSS
jgi:hypothetical protein